MSLTEQRGKFEKTNWDVLRYPIATVSLRLVVHQTGDGDIFIRKGNFNKNKSI